MHCFPSASSGNNVICCSFSSPRSLSAVNQINPALSPVLLSYNGQSFHPVNTNLELNANFTWCATQAAVSNFLQFDFKRTVLVYGLIVQKTPRQRKVGDVFHDGIQFGWISMERLQN